MIAALILAAVLAGERVQHVVLVLLDDCGTDKIGAYGHPAAGPTPTIDAMAAGGIRFDRAYANPTCSPTRAALLTGLYGSRTGVDTGVPTYDPASNPNGSFVPSDDLPWLPHQLASIGARSYLVGKWHLAHVEQPAYHQDPIAKGFVRWRGHLSNIIPEQGEGLYSWHKQAADSAGWTETATTTFVTTDNALEAWNALHASAGHKSFILVALQAPHPPWDELPPAGLYAPVAGPQTDAVQQQYALQAADTLIGQLMAYYALMLPTDAAGTLWLVMGDNGTPAAAIEPPTAAHEHKATVYEGGVHVPLIAYGAGVSEPGRSTDRIVHAVDLWATIQEALGVRRSGPRTATDSRSWAGLLADPGALPARTVAYVRHASPNGFVVKDWREHAAIEARWKLVRRSGLAPAVQLFDLETDPQEQANLWPPSTPDEDSAVALLEPVLAAGDATEP